MSLLIIGSIIGSAYLFLHAPPAKTNRTFPRRLVPWLLVLVAITSSSGLAFLLLLNQPTLTNRDVASASLQSPQPPLAELVETNRDSIITRSSTPAQPRTLEPGDFVRFNTDEDYELIRPWEVIKYDANSEMVTVTHPQFEDGTQLERPISEIIAQVDSSLNNLQQLYQQLIAPIEELLPTNPDDQIIFIPQGELFLIPFVALQDEEGNYLIEKHTILTAPAIQVLDLTSQAQAEKRQEVTEALVVGNPTMPIISLSESDPKPLTSLPHAEAEAKKIAALLNTQAITGDDATISQVLNKMPTAPIIHFATHGLLGDIKQLGTPGALALAPDKSLSSQQQLVANDGFLTSGDIVQLKLKADLVVLSACNTGRGKITGDGVVGLSRSFMQAGVPSVVVSLWSVPDAPTAELMILFYQNYLDKGMNKAQALRQAMLSIMKQHPEPVNWAGFTIMGEAE